MRSPRPGFTAIELVVVIGIISVLAALTGAAVLEGRSAARTTQCLSNFQNLGTALVDYSNIHKRLPVSLRPQLDEYLSNTSGVYVCPNDRYEYATNSYGAYYIPHYSVQKTDGKEALIRCPRHPHGEGWLTLAIDRATNGNDMTCTSVEEGALLTSVAPNTPLPDGSYIEGQNLMVVMARQEGPLNRWHIVISLHPPIGGSAFGKFTVKHGSNFEVVSPTGIAAVEGTVFTVKSEYIRGDKDIKTKVRVYDGKVRVRDFDESRGKLVLPGKWRYLERDHDTTWPDARDDADPIRLPVTDNTGVPTI